MRTLVTILRVFVTLPIWYFMLYTLLKTANVDRLVWFLFYVYVPAGIIASIIEAKLQAELK